MLKKIERRGRINYDDLDSEVDDMLSCLEEDEEDLRTGKEEDFDTFERNYNNKNTNNNIIKKENKNVNTKTSSNND